MIEYKVTINGIDVAARYTVREVDEIFLPLLRELDRLQKEKGHRILAMLAAPPGAGKTTLLSFLQKLSRETEGIRANQAATGRQGNHQAVSEQFSGDRTGCLSEEFAGRHADCLRHDDAHVR
jgi:hypothetical protein